MKKQTGLGKGLGALIPKKDFLKHSIDSLPQIEIKQIRVNKYQPRETFNPQKLEELVESIREKGVIEPIIVTKEKQGYQLICGERRLRASKMLDLKKIPAVIKRNISKQEILQISLVENIQRQDLNVIEQAKGIKKLISDFKLSQEEVARVISKQRSSISHLLRLLTLPIEIQEGLKEEKVSFGHAKALLVLKDKDKQKIIFNRIIKSGLSVRETEELIKKTTISAPHILRKQRVKNPQVKEVEEDLEKFLGTKVRIFLHKKGGRIGIEFYSLNDLERVLKKIQRNMK